MPAISSSGYSVLVSASDDENAKDAARKIDAHRSSRVRNIRTRARSNHTLGQRPHRKSVKEERTRSGEAAVVAARNYNSAREPGKAQRFRCRLSTAK